MAFGLMPPAMLEDLKIYVKGHTVYDLLAGDLYYSHKLLTLGATQVYAIDKEDVMRGRTTPNLHFKHARLQDVSIPAHPEPDVVFCSWPPNHPVPGLVEWARRARIFIYLGCNFGGTACGHSGLFETMLQRKLLKYHPHRSNSMIVLGEWLTEERDPTPEEEAHFKDEIIPF